MNENDKITKLPRRTLSASNYATPITNQANVATRLHESFGKKAHDLVWQAELHEWEDKAREYVNLVYGNHYGTRWVTNGGNARVHGAGDADVPVEASDSTARPVYLSTVIVPRFLTDPGANLDQVSAQHPSPTPLAAFVRSVGGTV